MDTSEQSKVVMARGRWPEENYQDFLVFHLRENETDDEAIARAKEAYNDPAMSFISLPCPSKTSHQSPNCEHFCAR